DAEPSTVKDLAGRVSGVGFALFAKLQPDTLGKLAAHAYSYEHLELAAYRLLGKVAERAGAADIAAAAREIEGQERAMAARLEARGDSPSKLKDAALRLGALNWGTFFAAQPDTPAKLAGFAYAVEHLEIAAYELLARIAERAGDHDTAELARAILAEERAA